MTLMTYINPMGTPGARRPAPAPAAAPTPKVMQDVIPVFNSPIRTGARPTRSTGLTGQALLARMQSEQSAGR